jgi:hypothetical protein
VFREAEKAINDGNIAEALRVDDALSGRVAFKFNASRPQVQRFAPAGLRSKTERAMAIIAAARAASPVKQNDARLPKCAKIRLTMHDAFHQQRLTHSLELFSARLDELIEQVRRESYPLPSELIDEIASTTGELMLLLIDHQSVFRVEEATSRAISEAQRLREAMRSERLPGEQVAEVVSMLTREVAQIISADKRAA